MTHTGGQTQPAGVWWISVFYLLLLTLYTHLWLNPPPPLRLRALIYSFGHYSHLSELPGSFRVSQYFMCSGGGPGPLSPRSICLLEASTRAVSQQTRGWGGGPGRGGQQTSNHTPARRLQLGSCGKSAKLFIGLMGCRLQFTSQYYLTEAPEWSASANGLAISGCSDARRSHRPRRILPKKAARTQTE